MLSGFFYAIITPKPPLPRLGAPCALPRSRSWFWEHLQHAKPQLVRFCWNRFAASCYNNPKIAAAAAGRTLCAPALPRVVLGTLQHAKPQLVRFCWNRFAASCYNNPKTAAAAAGRTLCAPALRAWFWEHCSMQNRSTCGFVGTASRRHAIITPKPPLPRLGTPCALTRQHGCARG